MTNELDTAANTSTNTHILTDRVFISYSDLKTSVPAIAAKLQASEKALNVPEISGFTGELETGFNLAIVPYTDATKHGYVKGSDVEKKIVAYVVAPIPSLEMLMQTDEGKDFILKAVNASLVAKLLASVKDKLKGNANKITEALINSIELPTTLADFIERKRSKFDLEAWKFYSKPFCSMLKDKKDFTISPAALRLVFSNAAIAKRDHPKIAQSTWEGMLVRLMQTAKAANFDTTLFEHWLTTRDQETLAEGKELSLDGLFEDAEEDETDTDAA